MNPSAQKPPAPIPSSAGVVVLSGLARLDNKKDARVTLTKESLIIHVGMKDKKVLIEDVFSVQYRPNYNPNLMLFLVKRKNPKKSKRVSKEYSLLFDNQEMNIMWARTIYSMAIPRYPGQNPRRNVTVLVEQVYGKKYGLSVYEDIVHPMLSVATDYINPTVMRIHSPGDGLLVVNSLEMTCDGILIVGGDHLLCEVVQSMIRRFDNEMCFKRWAIGILPAGDSNVAAENVISSDPREAMLFCLKGYKTNIPIANIFRSSKFPSGMLTSDIEQALISPTGEQLLGSFYTKPDDVLEEPVIFFSDEMRSDLQSWKVISGV